MKQYKYLLFDADNTLFDFDKSEDEAFRLTMQEFSLPSDPNVSTIYHSVNDALWKALERGEITQSKLRVERFRQLLEIIHGDQSLADSMNHVYVKNLSAMSYTLESAESVLKALSSEFPIYLVTNGLYEVQSKRFAASPLAAYIKDIFISEKIGVSKPAKEYFDYVMANIGDPIAQHYLVIGDSLTSDIKGAAVSGMDSVWFNPHKKQATDARFTYTVERLTELIPLLLENN